MTADPDLSTKAGVIRHALRGVIDPEIGLSVVEVGLIYDIRVEDKRRVFIEMTTTTRGCPAAQYLVDAVRERALATGVVDEVDVALAYDPPWSPDMMHRAG